MSSQRVIDSNVSLWGDPLRVVEEGSIRRIVAERPGNRWLVSAIDTHDPRQVLPPYLQIMGVMSLLHPHPLRVLNLGLGGGNLPASHLSRYPNSEVLSVEIDPIIIALTRAHFGLENPRHWIIEGDGCAYIGVTAEKFDLIWIDIGNGGRESPRKFLTSEFFDELKEVLQPEGMVVLYLTEKHASELPEVRARIKSRFGSAMEVEVPRTGSKILGLGLSGRVRCDAFLQGIHEWTAQGLRIPAWPEGPECVDY